VVDIRYQCSVKTVCIPEKAGYYAFYILFVTMALIQSIGMIWKLHLNYMVGIPDIGAVNLLDVMPRLRVSQTFKPGATDMELESTAMLKQRQHPIILQLRASPTQAEPLSTIELR
jgi:hypothetical protein